MYCQKRPKCANKTRIPRHFAPELKAPRAHEATPRCVAIPTAYLNTFFSITPKWGADGTQSSIEFRTMLFASPTFIPERM